MNVGRQYREGNTFMPYATYAIMAACLLMYTVTGGRGGFGDTSGEVLVQFGSMYPPDVWRGEWWRLISCTFLHGGILHIAFNMYVLYQIGPAIERTYGIGKFLLIYFVTGWTSSLLSLVWSGSNSVGASGAIFGLAGAFLAISLRRRSYWDTFGSQMLIFIGINIAIGFSGTFGNIDNFGHLGGLIGGFILGNIVPNTLPEFRATPARWAGTVAAVLLFGAITPFAVKMSREIAYSRAEAEIKRQMQTDIGQAADGQADDGQADAERSGERRPNDGRAD